MHRQVFKTRCPQQELWVRRRAASGAQVRTEPDHPPMPPALLRLSEPPGPACGQARKPRVSAGNARPPSPPRCAWTGTSSAGGPSSAGSLSAGAGCGPAPGAPRPRGCRCPWQRPTEGARRRWRRRRGRRPPRRHGARGWKAEREAARPAWRDLGLRWGPREARRRRSGGPAKTHWRLRLLLLRPPHES